MGLWNRDPCGRSGGPAGSVDVHLEDQYLVVRHNKNGRERLVPFSDVLADVLGQYRQALEIQPTADKPR